MLCVAGSSNNQEVARGVSNTGEDEVEAEQRQIQNGKSQQEPEQELDWVFTVTDPALWGDTSSDRIKTVLIDRGAASFHNRRSKYPASARDRSIRGKARSLTNDMLVSLLPNGKTIGRDWLIYSPSTGNVYRFACKLLSTKSSQFVYGFCDWKHPERLCRHENSEEHKACMVSYRKRSKGTQTIHVGFEKQIKEEKHYWREVLRRVAAVIKFLAERGLPFRGDDELLYSPHNGNYLGILEVIAQFDPFLAGHLENYGQKGRGRVSYSSSTT